MSRSSTCSTAAAWPARRCCSASTAPRTAIGSAPRSSARNADVPLMIIAIGDPATIGGCLAGLEAMIDGAAGDDRARPRPETRRATTRRTTRPSRDRFDRPRRLAEADDLHRRAIPPRRPPHLPATRPPAPRSRRRRRHQRPWCLGLPRRSRAPRRSILQHRPARPRRHRDRRHARADPPAVPDRRRVDRRHGTRHLGTRSRLPRGRRGHPAGRPTDGFVGGTSASGGSRRRARQRG